MYKYLIFMVSGIVSAGPYIEAGIAVPLYPDAGYTPDSYGIASLGYIHHIDEFASINIGLVHRSVTGVDHCNNDNCYGDNAIETKLRFEWK